MTCLSAPSLADLRPSFTGDWLASNSSSRQLVEHHLISRSEAIARAKQRSSGKVLSAELVNRGKSPFYRVKVLTAKGHVRTLRISALR